MADAATTPIWVTLVVPVITAAATWMTTKLELLSLNRVKEYQGTWYAYYRDPDTKGIEEEIWSFSTLGRVSVSRAGRTTFKGSLVLRSNKAYMDVHSTMSGDERLLVMLDTPNNPRNGDSRPCGCIWLGKSGDHTTTAGHGLLSRTRLESPPIRDEFIQAKRGVIAPATKKKEDDQADPKTIPV